MNVHSGFICINKTKEKKETPPQKKKPREWINKLGYTYTIEYYSAMKTNEQLIYTCG